MCHTSTSPPPYDNGQLVINAVNRHPDQSLGADFELEDKQFSGPVAVSEVNGPNIKSENDFDKTTVKTVERSATAEGRRLRYTFPPHSYTMLKVEDGLKSISWSGLAGCTSASSRRSSKLPQ